MAYSYGKKVTVSYDIDSADHAFRAKVCRLVFGSTSRKAAGPTTRVYRYHGVLEQRGTKYVGQSVLMLPPKTAEWFTRKLASLGVRHEAIAVYLRHPA